MMRITLAFDGELTQYVRVANLEQAAMEFAAHRDAFGYGASDMMRGCGDVKRGSKLMGKVSYNGRVWRMDDNGAWQAADGMSGAEWLRAAEVTR